MKYIKLILFLFAFFYFLILTMGIPFFWQDHALTTWFERDVTFKNLTNGIENAFRPFENLVYTSFLNLFGVTPIPFRIFKALFAAGVVLLLYSFVKEATIKKGIPILALIFYLTSAAVFESVLLIYDFEIVAQFFLLAAIVYFLKAYKKEDSFSKELFFFILLTYLAVLTKESAKILVIIIIMFITLTNIKKWKYFVYPVAILFFLSWKPWILFWPEMPSRSLLLFGNPEFYKLVLFIKYVLIQNFSISFLLLFLLGWLFLRKKIEAYYLFKNKEGYSLLFFGLWFVSTSVLALFLALGERRYAIVPLLPFVAAIFIFFAKAKNIFLIRRKFIILIVVLIILNVGFNFSLSLKYRYGFGNFIKVLEKGKELIVQQYHNGLFIMLDYSSYFLEWKTKPNNLIVDTFFNVSKMSPEAKINLFILDPHTTLNHQQYQNVTLEKTFINGPHCMMLYKFGEDTIKTANLELEPIEGTKQRLDYNFSQEPPSYCDIQLETWFLFPQKIEIILFTENESLIKTIIPPIGKYKSCSYTCPSIKNGNSTIKSVEIKTRKSFFNKLYSGKIYFK